jgi:hypothetical protein
VFFWVNLSLKIYRHEWCAVFSAFTVQYVGKYFSLFVFTNSILIIFFGYYVGKKHIKTGSCNIFKNFLHTLSVMECSMPTKYNTGIFVDGIWSLHFL